MNKIVVIAHDIRSAHNVGSIIRTCEGMAVSRLYLSGITPYPKLINDTRLPHLSARATKQITKTSLSAEDSLDIRRAEDIYELLRSLKESGYLIVGLEQTDKSKVLPKAKLDLSIAVIIGRETLGIEGKIISECDELIEIPMLGKKESFNVVQALAIFLYEFRRQVMIQ